MKLGKLAPVVFILALFLILSIGYVYFFQISPTFVNKPELEKPSQEFLTENHVEFLLNELGAYKLHKDPFTGEPPYIEVVVDEVSYYITVENNEIKIIEHCDPDLRIYSNPEVLLQMFQSKNIEEEITKLFLEGKISIEILADEKTLALKGYKTIYDAISDNELTGNVVLLNPIEITKGMNLSFLFLVSFIIGLIIEKI